jgi:hypothetical protein
MFLSQKPSGKSRRVASRSYATDVTQLGPLSLQGGWAVSPAELREALGALSGGGFGLSDMHDAAEVLGELLACLHRCVLLQDSGVSLEDSCVVCTADAARAFVTSICNSAQLA